MSVPPPWVVRVLTGLADTLAKLRRRLIPRRAAVLELGTYSWVSLAISAFCELGLPDALAQQSRSADDLAASGYGDRARLFRLLRALCAYDIVRYAGNDRFALGYLGQTLAGNDSAASMVRYANAPWHISGHAQLAAGVRQKRSGFEIAMGTGLFEYLQAHPDAGALFDAAMESLSPQFANAFAAAYDFANIEHVVDIGGGTGMLLATVLERHAHVRGTLFERPEVEPRVRAGERLGVARGDMFSDPPPTADAYIFAHVLHDWDDDSCVRILQNLRRAMPSHGRVLVYEIVAAPPNNRWSQDRLQDLEMLAILPGRERTRDEFDALFTRAGFRLHRVIATGAPESILEVLPKQ